MEVFRPYRIFCESKNMGAVQSLVKQLWSFYEDENGYKTGVPTFIIHEIDKETVDIKTGGDRKALFYNADLNDDLANLAKAYAAQHPLVLTIHVGWLDEGQTPYNLKNVQPSTAERLASDVMLVSGDFIIELNKKILERFV